MDARPQARREGLACEAVGDELIAYDLSTDTIHNLDRPSHAVWQAADGTRSIADIATHTRLERLVVEQALEQLADHDLLATTAGALSRRDALVRTARTGAMAAAALAAAAPVVTSIVAPTPAHAQSAACEQDVECTSHEQCFGGFCGETSGGLRCQC